MRKLDRSKAFKRDFKKRGDLDTAMIEVLYLLLNDDPLPTQYKDHALTGNYKGFRECHIKPDLLLIYKKAGDYLQLARLGSHSELF